MRTKQEKAIVKNNFFNFCYNIDTISKKMCINLLLYKK